MDVVVLRAVLSADHSNLTQGVSQANRELTEFGEKVFDGPTVRFRANRDELDNPQGPNAPSRGGGSPRPSTARPERVAATTAAAVEQIERTSQARQTAIASEGESRRASIEAQANARQEAQQRAHLQRLIQQQQAAENRAALRPRMTMGERGQSMIERGQNLSGAGRTATMAFAAPVAITGGLMLREGIKWESSFAGVKKTVDGSVTSLRELNLELRDMAAGKNAIPIDVNELAQIAESAGALGIQREGIVDFTRTMAMLGTTTDLSSDQAANGLAKIANVMGTAQGEYDRFGSSLVALGNAGASTESQILDVSERISGAGKQIGLSEAQVMGVGSALSSVGIEAEAGGTAVSTAFVEIEGAVRKGGEELDAFAKVAGMSSADFKKAWQNNSAGAFTSFVEGLGKIDKAGGDTFSTLEKLEMSDVRLRDAMLRLSGAGDLLRTSIKTGETAWRENTAMATEAGKRYETTASQLQILQNRVKEIAIKSSEGILPGVNAELKKVSESVPEAAEKIGAAWEGLGPAGKKAAIGFAAVTALSGPMAEMVGNVQTLSGAWMSLVGTVGKAKSAIVAARAASVAGSAASGAAAAGAGAAGAAGAAAAGAAGVGAAGAGAGAAGAGGGALAFLVSNPVGWAILAAAIIAAIALAIKYKSNYDDILERNERLKRDAKEMDVAFKGAMSGASDNKLKKDLTDLQEQTKKAGENAKKLGEALQNAKGTKVRIQKMDLDPHAKDPLLQQIDNIIASIESTRKIRLQIESENKPTAAPKPPPGFKLSGRSFVRVTKEDEIREKAQKLGIQVDAPRSGHRGYVDPKQLQAYREAQAMGMALPEKPRRPSGRSPITPEFTKKEAEYQKALAALESKINALDQENQRLSTNSQAAAHANRFDARANAALREYGNNLSKLIEVQKEYDKSVKQGYKPDAKEKEAMGHLQTNVNELKAKVQADHKTRTDRDAASATQAAADLAAKQAADAEKAAEAQRELQDRLLELETRALQKRLSLWNSFGSAVESVVSGINQIGAEGGDKMRFATEAQMASREFADIPPHLKSIVVGLAAINDQMRELTATRDEMRGLFGDMFKDALRSGADVGPIKQAAAFFEKRLDYERKMNALQNRGARASEKVIGITDARQFGLSTQIESVSAQRATNRKAGDVESGASSAATSATTEEGSKVAAIASARFDSGKSSLPRFKRRCQELAETAYYEAGVTAYDAILKQKGNALQTMKRFQKAGIGQTFTPGMTLAPGGLLYSNSMGGKDGHVQTIGTDGARYDQYGRNKFKESNFQWYVPPPGQPIAPATGANASSTKAPSPVAPMPVDRAARYKAPGASEYDGSLLQSALPKGWGKAVTDSGLRPNESRGWQMRLQEMMSDTDKATKDAARFGMSLDQYASVWKRIAVGQDLADSGARAREGLRGQLRDLERNTTTQKRFSGRENAYASTQMDMERGDYDFLTQEERANLLFQTRGNILAQSAAQSRTFRDAEKDNQKILAAARPHLQGANADLAKYNDELERARIRVEAWNRIQPLLDTAASERDPKKAQATRKRAHEQFYAEVNTATSTKTDTALDASLRAVLEQNQGRRDGIALLEFEIGLLERGTMTAQERARAMEVQRVEQETLNKLMRDNPKATPTQVEGFEGRAQGAGRLRGEEFDKATSRDFKDRRDAEYIEAKRELSRANSNTALVSKYATDDPALRFELERGRAQDELDKKYESKRTRGGAFKTKGSENSYNADMAREEARIRAQITFDLTSERVRAEQDAAIAVIGAERDVANSTARTNAERLANEIAFQNAVRVARGQGAMSAKEEASLIRRFNLEMQRDRINAATEAQVATLDAERAVRDATAYTAAQRLAIEKWYLSEVRKLRGQEALTPEEEAEMEKQGGFKKEGEEIDKMKRRAEDARGMFRDSIRQGFDEGITAGLEGMGKRILDSFVNAQIDSIATDMTRKMYGDKSMPDAERSGGVDILGSIFGRGPKRAEDYGGGLNTPPVGVGAPLGGPRVPGVPYNPAPFTAPFYARNAVTQNEGVAARVARAAGIGRNGDNGTGKMNVTSLMVNTPRTDIRSATTNVNGGVSGTGGGGSGTSKSGDQALGDVLGIASMFA